MDNNNQKPSQPESSLLNSLNLHTSSILTSTKNSGPLCLNLLDVNHRKAISTPNRLTVISQSIGMTNNDDELTSEQKHVITRGQGIFGNKQVEIMDCVDDPSQSEQIEDEQHFHSFIIEHFIPFSDKQNVIHWLDETKTQVTQLKNTARIRRSDAKRIYIKNRKEIQSFDDFYESLLANFDTSSLLESKFSQKVIDDITNQNEPNINTKEKTVRISNNTNFTHKSPAFRSNIVADLR